VSRPVTALLLVLLIQCGIVAAVYWPKQLSLQGDAAQTLAPFAASAVDEIRIGDEFDNEAVLRRAGAQWLLPDRDNLPADSAKVDSLLRNLTAQSGSLPIARTPAARQRFQVAEYYYQRRLTLMSGGQTLGTIYLGTSPGFRKLHARNESQDAIYSITLNAQDVPAVNGGWLDPGLLQVRAPVRIDADLYNLSFENGHWQSLTGGTPDEKELNALINALKNLEVEGIANEDLQRELSGREADLVLQIQSLGGEETLELVTLNGQHFVHSSRYPPFFKLNAYDFDKLTGVDVRLLAGEEREP
jgi:hypothetical protein